MSDMFRISDFIGPLCFEGKWGKFLLLFPAEEEERRQIFQENLVRIRARNAEFDRGQTSYELRVNCFGDRR